jgi:hypothetical protein
MIQNAQPYIPKEGEDVLVTNVKANPVVVARELSNQERDRLVNDDYGMDHLICFLMCICCPCIFLLG